MITFKAGTTFIATVIHRDKWDRSISIENIGIESALGNTRHRYELDVIKKDEAAGIFEIYAPAEVTKDWVAGIYQWDIIYNDDNKVISNPQHQNFLIEVFKGPTV